LCFCPKISGIKPVIHGKNRNATYEQTQENYE